MEKSADSAMPSSAPRGAKLSHATWHPVGSPQPVPRAENAEDVARALRHSPDEASRPPVRRRSSLNMKGILRSVSTHSFSRRSSESAASAAAATARAEDSKGWLLEKQGKLDQAEIMYSRSCLRIQRSQGKESLSLAEHLDRLVNLLYKEGKLAEAEPLSRRSLEIRQKALGEDNPEVATAMINLARVLDAKGDYADALLFLRQGLGIRERILEEGHPDIVSAMAWIGDIYNKQEEYQQALDIAKRVAEAHEARLGPDDIKVASSLNNVAGLLATLGKTEEALPLFVRANAIYVRQLGKTHPRSVATQLWVQQLSAPPPPPRVRRRAPHLPSGRAVGTGSASRLSNPPPPLIEGPPGTEDSSAHADALPPWRRQQQQQHQEQKQEERKEEGKHQQHQQQPVR